jgi:hypothetical protein
MLTQLHRLTTLLLLSTLLVSTAWSQDPAAQAPKPRAIDIRPTDHKAWGNSPERVQAILVSAANELWRYFPERSLKPILVEPKDGPITLFDRGPGGEYRVRLNTGANLWSQWVFQFAHEFGHILSNYDAVAHENKWFEETICEVASLFVLRRLADTWKKGPAPPNWKNYAPNLQKYAQERIDKAQLPPNTTLPQWYEANARRLAKTGYDRDMNTLVAVQLLPLFEKEPEHWEAIADLARAKKGHSESLADFLKAWQTHCPEKHRAFVAALAAKFAIDLERVNLGPPKP